MSRGSLALLSVLLAPSSAVAQTSAPGEPPPNVRMRLGPLYVNPTLLLTNAGVDTNVFNQSADIAAPKEDFTATVTPGSQFWLRFGHTWFTGTLREGLVYFNKYASERSANTDYRSTWVVPLNRVVVNAGMGYLSTRDRPGFEIDARSQRMELAYNASIELRALPKTFVGVRGERRRVEFDKAAVFLGTSLHDELTRTMTTGALTVRHHLTPLTDLTFDVSRKADRFAFSPLRNADSTEVAAGVKLDAFALIAGSAKIGYRDFNPLTPGLPGYRGSTASVDLAYVALSSTRLGVQVARDIQFSYLIGEPYYVDTGINGSIQQEVFGPVALAARVGVQRLAYRARSDALVQASGRLDQVRSIGGGVIYQLGRDVRAELNIDKQTRRSLTPGVSYDGIRAGIGVTYGQ